MVLQCAVLCCANLTCAVLYRVLCSLFRYEDVLHEGNLDEDTPHEEPPPVPDNETGAIAEYDRQKRK
jgi:hypothetical protein